MAQSTEEQNTVRLCHVYVTCLLDNIFVERLWRTVKQEEVYPNDYPSLFVGRQRLNRYFSFYNNMRFHQSLDYQTPASVYFSPNDQSC